MDSADASHRAEGGTSRKAEASPDYSSAARNICDALPSYRAPDVHSLLFPDSDNDASLHHLHCTFRSFHEFEIPESRLGKRSRPRKAIDERIRDAFRKHRNNRGVCRTLHSASRRLFARRLPDADCGVACRRLRGTLLLDKQKRRRNILDALIRRNEFARQIKRDNKKYGDIAFMQCLRFALFNGSIINVGVMLNKNKKRRA